jgi:hypothetical protein
MPSAGYEPAIRVIQRPQTNTLDRMATGIVRLKLQVFILSQMKDNGRTESGLCTGHVINSSDNNKLDTL